MGYYIEQRDCDFRIKAENVSKALDALKALASRVNEGGGGTYKGGQLIEKYFSWVTTEEFANATTLEEALWAWHWEVEYCGCGCGDVAWIMFQGEKYGDEPKLLEALAPYVEAGCFIEMSGEDGALWRWSFDGSDMEEKSANISWE